MANKDDFDVTGRFKGVVSQRPRDRKNEKEGEPTLYGYSFQMTSDRKIRLNRDGGEYNADPMYDLTVWNLNDDENAQHIFNQVADFQIGDKIEIEVAVVTKMRRGFQSVSLRVLDLRNGD